MFYFKKNYKVIFDFKRIIWKKIYIYKFMDWIGENKNKKEKRKFWIYNLYLLYLGLVRKFEVGFKYDGFISVNCVLGFVS